MSEKFKIADVDGTVPGVCVATAVYLDPDQSAEVLVSVDKYVETYFPDPQETAERVWRSCEGDFPGAVATFAMNQRARFLMMNRRMELMGLGVMTPDEYWKEYGQ